MHSDVIIVPTSSQVMVDYVTNMTLLYMKYRE